MKAKSWFKFVLFLAVFAFIPNYVWWNAKSNTNCKDKNETLSTMPSGDKIMNIENNISKDDSEWQVVKEPHEFRSPSGEITKYDVTSIKRKDGFTLSLVGAEGRGLDDVFLVKGNFGEFKIRARRLEQRDPIGYEQYIEAGGYPYVISDTYIVYIQYCRRPEAGKNDRDFFKFYSKDIESALLHYPAKESDYKNIPVRKVIFDIGEKWTTPHYVQAKDF